jgi:hypothetical protein
MILHLGVIDLPYQQLPSKRRKRSTATVTTGDVAEFLENRYHIMEVFFHIHEADIASDVDNSAEGAIESILMGAPVSANPFASAASSIESRMKQFVATGEMDRLGYPGVPTQAAKDRASGKRRSPRFKRRRPTGAAVSFVATGLYNASETAWID